MTGQLSLDRIQYSYTNASLSNPAVIGREHFKAALPALCHRCHSSYTQNVYSPTRAVFEALFSPVFSIYIRSAGAHSEWLECNKQFRSTGSSSWASDNYSVALCCSYSFPFLSPQATGYIAALSPYIIYVLWRNGIRTMQKRCCCLLYIMHLVLFAERRANEPTPLTFFCAYSDAVRAVALR